MLVVNTSVMDVPVDNSLPVPEDVVSATGKSEVCHSQQRLPRAFVGGLGAIITGALATVSGTPGGRRPGRARWAGGPSSPGCSLRMWLPRLQSS